MTKIPDGWIEHDGSACPVPWASYPAIMFRDGLSLVRREFRKCAKDLRWTHWGTDTDIIAYKVETPDHET